MLQAASLANLLVEVSDDGDVESGRAGLDPILADLVAVAGMDGLDLVAEVVNQPHHGLEVPACAAQTLPYLHIVVKGSEGDQGIVRRAASKNLSSGVSDV